MTAQQWAEQALQSFETVVQASAGFRARAGQRSMAERVAQTFASAELGKREDDGDGAEPQRAIAVIEAGTGVGTSLAGRLLMLDGRSMEWSTLHVQRALDCAVCGAR